MGRFLDGVRGAFPSRLFAPEDYATWPPPPGGQGGTIASPSRIAALEGQGVPQQPSRVQPAVQGPGGYDPAIANYAPPTDATVYGGGYGASKGMPVTWIAEHYVRQWRDNIGGLVNFIRPRNGPTSWTLNLQEPCCDPVPGSPIPFARKFVSWALLQPFDSNVQTRYMAPVLIQKGQAVRGQRADTPRMLDPYFPRLTELASPTSYGQQTQLLTPTRTSTRRGNAR